MEAPLGSMHGVRATDATKAGLCAGHVASRTSASMFLVYFPRVEEVGVVLSEAAFGSLPLILFITVGFCQARAVYHI